MLSRIRLWIGGFILALLPILYKLGKLAGRKDQQRKQLSADLKQETKKTDFYKGMLEDAQDRTPVRNRNDLIDRLRDEGF